MGSSRKRLSRSVPVFLLCVASVIITYDTIVVKKPADVKSEPEAAPIAPEKGEPQKEELAKPKEPTASIKDELKKRLRSNKRRTISERWNIST